jgi:hypothetical protein
MPGWFHLCPLRKRVWCGRRELNLQGLAACGFSHHFGSRRPAGRVHGLVGKLEDSRATLEGVRARCCRRFFGVRSDAAPYGAPIGDVALLARERISKDRSRWRIFLLTEKSCKPVFLTIPTEPKAALDQLPLPAGATRRQVFLLEWHQFRTVDEKHRRTRTTHRIRQVREYALTHSIFGWYPRILIFKSAA